MLKSVSYEMRISYTQALLSIQCDIWIYVNFQITQHPMNAQKVDSQHILVMCVILARPVLVYKISYTTYYTCV